MKGSVNIPDIGKYPGYTFRISDHKLEYGSFDITAQNNSNVTLRLSDPKLEYGSFDITAQNNSR